MTPLSRALIPLILPKLLLKMWGYDGNRSQSNGRIQTDYGPCLAFFEKGKSIPEDASPGSYLLTCDSENVRFTLILGESRKWEFESIEDALDYLQNVRKGANVRAVTPTGQTMFETKV